MENRTLIQKLKALDLGPIAYKLMYPELGFGLTYEQTNQILVRYVMFLFLVYMYPNIPIVPTKEIDLVWHQHILDTSKYAHDSQMLFGRFLHHYPYADVKVQEVAFAQTKQLFEKHFGADAVGGMNFLEDGKSQQPADCETLRKQKQQRPSVHIELAEALQAFRNV